MGLCVDADTRWLRGLGIEVSDRDVELVKEGLKLQAEAARKGACGRVASREEIHRSIHEAIQALKRDRQDIIMAMARYFDLLEMGRLRASQGLYVN